MSSNKIPQNPKFDTKREFTSEQITRLNSILECNLGPEFISKRPNGYGGPVSYIEGFKALNLANYVFGFNGWNSEIRSTTVDYVDDHGGNGRFSIGLSVIIRISLKDGTFHEDIGYGSVENAKGRPAAFEKAKKQAITDGMKRCLRCFGNVLGNCLYDKDYLKYISKVKTPVPKFNEAKLLRHPDIIRLNKIKQLEDLHDQQQQPHNSSIPVVPIITNNNTLSSHNISASKLSQIDNSNRQPSDQHRQPLTAKHGKILTNITNNSVSSHNANANTSNNKKNSSSPQIGSSTKPMSAIDAKKNTMLTESLFEDSFDDNFGDEDDEFNDIDEYELELITNKITSSTNMQPSVSVAEQQNKPIPHIVQASSPMKSGYSPHRPGMLADAVEDMSTERASPEEKEALRFSVEADSNNEEITNLRRVPQPNREAVPSSVVFVSAKSAAVGLGSTDPSNSSNSNSSISFMTVNKSFKTNIKSKSIDHTRSTPIKRSMVDRQPIYPSSKYTPGSNPNKRVNMQ